MKKRHILLLSVVIAIFIGIGGSVSPIIDVHQMTDSTHVLGYYSSTFNMWFSRTPIKTVTLPLVPCGNFKNYEGCPSSIDFAMRIAKAVVDTNYFNRSYLTRG